MNNSSSDLYGTYFDTLILIWLKLALNDNSSKTFKIYNHFKDTKKLFEGSIEEYSKICTLNDKDKENLLIKNLSTAYDVLQTCINNNIDIIPIMDQRYPRALADIDNPPCLLFARGNYDYAVSKPMIAVVGTRKCTDYGIRVTSEISGGLAIAGCTIVTGVAEGIDEAAYKNAIKANGSVIFVIPDGMFCNQETRRIKNSELNKSVIISEHLPHSKQTNYAYPERNRIISGIAKGCLVTQAPTKSGALITANHAIEQGKDLFVVPANIDIPQSVGSNMLFFDGAFPVFGYKDILDILKIPYDKDMTYVFNEHSSYFDSTKKSNFPTNVDFIIAINRNRLSEPETKILKLFEISPLTLDYINKNLNIPVPELLRHLSKLEALGLIESLPGNNFRIIKLDIGEDYV